MSDGSVRVASRGSCGARWRGWGLAVLVALLGAGLARAQDDDKVVRVFVFAGQSNMVGADSRATDIAKFPPFAGLEDARTSASRTGGRSSSRSTAWSGRSCASHATSRGK